MYHRLKTTLLIVLLAATAKTLHSQPVSEMDDHLAALLTKVTDWDEYRGDDKNISPSDSLDDVNTLLNDYLRRICLIPQTIKTSFPKAIKNGLTIVTSDDNKLRAYSWDTRLGGSMRKYSDAVQYAVAKGTLFQCMNCDTTGEDYGEDYTDITTVHTKDNKTVYFISGYSIVSTKDRAESIDAYAIENSALKKTNIFQTKTKRLSSIGYGYDQFASTDGKRDIPTIHFSKDNQKLYIPVVAGEIVTDKYLIYLFDGNNYVFDKNAK